MKIFGFDTSDPAGLQNAIKAAGQAVVALAPLFAEIENRAGGIGESWLDRLDGATLTLKLKPVPKAIPVNPDPEQSGQS